MTTPPVPDACTLTLAAIETDPLGPGPEAEAHLRACRSCQEARVVWLAQEEVPEVMAPAGYHQRLADRILRKLPVRTPLHRRVAPLTWAVAATLLMAVGAGAFWAGRANRTPLVEASLPRATEGVETTTVSDTPFHDREEDAARIHALSAEEMQALLKQLDSPSPSPK